MQSKGLSRVFSNTTVQKRIHRRNLLEEKKKTMTIRNAFDGLISQLDVTKERLNELEDRTIKTPQDEMQKKVSKNSGTISKGVTSA